MPAPSTFKRFVEVGRVVLITNGPDAGKIATVVEIIDHNRAIIDGPTSGVARQPFQYRHLVLTPFTVKGLPRGAGTGAVKKYVEKADIVAKWDASSWAKSRASAAKRRTLGDFDRFNVLLLKKQRRDAVNKSLAKAKKSA